jgi:methionyl-tRNA synthetase
MLHRNFDGVVPEMGPLSPASQDILAAAQAAFGGVGERFGSCQFRAGLQEALKLAQAANRYLDERAPWKAVKEDRAHAAETLATALNVINALKVLLHPVIPFSTARLHEDLGESGRVLDGGWAFHAIAAGRQLGQARALYAKLEVEVPA